MKALCNRINELTFRTVYNLQDFDNCSSKYYANQKGFLDIELME
jgi:hypothetical protein